MINSIKDELELYESSNDEKHLYAIEKLVQLLKGENSSTTNEPSIRKKDARPLKKRTLDDTYIAEDSHSSTSIFDF